MFGASHVHRRCLVNRKCLGCSGLDPVKKHAVMQTNNNLDASGVGKFVYVLVVLVAGCNARWKIQVKAEWMGIVPD